jgi:replicative DNA helicase
MSAPTQTRGLPASIESEKAVLASAMRDPALFDQAECLHIDDFILEIHRRIWKCITELRARGDAWDTVSVGAELERRGERESVGGLAYLCDLADGVPFVQNIESWVSLIHDKSVLRRTIFACQHMMNRCMEGECAADLLTDAEKTILALQDQSNWKLDNWVSAGDVIFKGPGGVQGFLCPPRGGMGIPTPWKPLTESLCGLHAGDLFVVAGRPSMGKSIVAAELCRFSAKSGYPAGIISLEMSREDIVSRWVASGARLDSQKLRQGFSSPEERRRAAVIASEINELLIKIDDQPKSTVVAITAAARRLNAQVGLKVLALDHLQLTKGASARDEQKRNNELSEICHCLKRLAREMKIVVILVSQLNRQCEIENRRPQLSDLKDTGSIEEDADVVLFVHRPERYAKNHNREDLRGVAEFIVAKQRVGPTGLMNMVFQAAFQRFDCSASQYENPELEGL